jgi:RiboL-PSP-HEPN
LVSGYVENAVVELVLAHCSRQSAPTVQKFVEITLGRFTNVHREKLLQLLGSFDSDWRAKLDEYIVDERDAALNSVIALRHQIAHGGSAGISYVRIKEYYSSIQEIVDYLSDLLDPIPVVK